MKTLILTVDRDDDIGTKASVSTPIVGRRRVLEAATGLGVADPEDSDTNSLFAAIHLYDKESSNAAAKGRQVEVAAITGHRAMGIRGDRKLARELEEVLDVTRADEVILVSDGAEDEQILPILTSRVKVAHVHRTIVRQAPRLEGFYYTLTRIIEDKKLARRYVLPVGLITLIWGGAFLMGVAQYAWGTTLALVGAWLIVHAMHWEDRMERFLHDLGQGMRSGKMQLFANILTIGLLAVGAVGSYSELPPATEGTFYRTLVFLQSFLFYFVAALLVRAAGLLIDEWVREGRAGLRHWTTAFTLIAVGFIGNVVLDVTIAVLRQAPLENVVTFELVLQLAAGLSVAAAGVLLNRYVRSFFVEGEARPEP